MPVIELQNSDEEVVELTEPKQFNEKAGRLACLPIGAQEYILEFLSPNYAFALLPLPGAIYRLFYHPQTTSSLQILLLKVSKQLMGGTFWTLFNNPAIPNATKLMMAAQYSQSIGVVPHQHSINIFVNYGSGTSKQDRKLIAELVWNYQVDGLSLSKLPIHVVCNDVINFLTINVGFYSDLSFYSGDAGLRWRNVAPKIDFLAKHWQQLSKDQQDNLTNLLQKDISRITPVSFHLLPLVKHLHLNSAQYATIRQEMKSIFGLCEYWYGYEFLNFFFILPAYEQDVIISHLERRNSKEYLEHLYRKCQDSTLKQKLFIACYQYANRQQNERYLYASVAIMRTCQVLDYFDYSHIRRFDRFDLLLDSAAKNIFPYQDIDSYVTDLSATDLSKLIDKIMDTQDVSYSIALAIAVYKQANQARGPENDDGFLVNILEHIKLQNFVVDDPNVYAVVELINHAALSTKQNQQVLDALIQNLQRPGSYPYPGDDNTRAIAQIVRLAARSNGVPAIQEMLIDCVAKHTALNLLIWHGNTKFEAISDSYLLRDIFATLKGTLRFNGCNRESQVHLDNFREILDVLQQSNYAEQRRSITVKEVRQKFERLVHCLCKNNTRFSLYRYHAQTNAAREFNAYLRSLEAHKLNQLLFIVYDRTLKTEHEISQLFKDIYEKRVRKRARTDADDIVINCDEHSYAARAPGLGK